jgi:hypothetical protein
LTPNIDAWSPPSGMRVARVQGELIAPPTFEQRPEAENFRHTLRRRCIRSSLPLREQLAEGTNHFVAFGLLARARCRICDKDSSMNSRHLYGKMTLSHTRRAESQRVERRTGNGNGERATANGNGEPRTANRERRTANRERRTANGNVNVEPGFVKVVVARSGG